MLLDVTIFVHRCLNFPPSQTASRKSSDLKQHTYPKDTHWYSGNLKNTEKELFILFAASAFRKLSSIYVFSYFPFGFEGRIWDLIVSVPDHCLSFYFLYVQYTFGFKVLIGLANTQVSTTGKVIILTNSITLKEHNCI